MKNIFYFGEKVQGYEVRVLNEREVRASAGILFVFAFFAFMTAILVANLFWIKLFIIIFFIDFFVRLFINPKYAPSLILGRIAVFNQKPEYAGAPQKKFAWGIGLALAIFMMLSLVLNLFFFAYACWICLLCLVFLFFESAFGICIGCKLYNVFNKDKAKLCPGGVCEVKRKEEIQKINSTQIIILAIFIALIILFFSLARSILASPMQSQSLCSGSNPVDPSGQVMPCFNAGANQVESENDCPALNFIN
jgi:hypothetical protein